MNVMLVSGVRRTARVPGAVRVSIASMAMLLGATLTSRTESAAWASAAVAQGAAAPASSPSSAASTAPTDTGWPRTYSKAGTTVVLHQPQVDAWQDHSQIKFRCAVEVTLAGQSSSQWGVLAAQADTAVSDDGLTVHLTNLRVVAVRFPSASATDAAALDAVVREMLPGQPVIALSTQRVIAHLHDESMPSGVPVNLQPPPIYYSSVPTALVTFMGQPQFKPVAGTSIMWATNTNWVVLLEGSSQQYYLLVGKSWMTAPDPVKGPWTAAQILPGDFTLLPSDGQWTDVQNAIPAQPFAVVPSVIVSTQPAELIATNGAPSYSAIPGTGLMYVNNPEMPVFMQLSTQTYYYLVAGRWFSAAQITGPWSAASESLPADFAKIPADSPMAFVLASVPGTQEARDAVLLAQVKHKATITIEGTTVDVTYDGPPKFVPIENTSMQYATNTNFQVVQAGSEFYCCNNGVWFVSPVATGPWTVCTSVPAVIYTIPPSCPLYNCTYVKVYSTTPDTVVVGYTSGYSGAYVATTGALMFGAGMVLGSGLATNWWTCSPCYYSYGCAAYYHGGYCGYYGAGWASYGPYGSAAWHAGYNPATGTYYRGGAVSGPGGAAWGGQAYNPWTGNYGQHTGGTNGYSSWGRSYVSNGSNWAEAGHDSNARGTVGAAGNSQGQWVEGAHSNATDSSIAKTSSGDTYAGHDGNVYKNTGDGWQKYDNGSWNNVQKPSGGSGSSGSAASSWQPKSSSGSGDWKSNWNDSNVQSRWNSSGSGGGGWDHETQNGLNSDSWSRNFGNGGSGSWGDHSSGGLGNGGGWGGQGGGGSGFGSGSGGGGLFSRFRGGGSGSFGDGGGGGWGGRGGGGFGGFSRGGFGGFRR